MIGQFIFPSCSSLGFDVCALMRNTLREEGSRVAPVVIDVSVFSGGELRGRHPRFGEIPPGGVLEISAATCPELQTDAEHLVVARCSSGPGNEYFSQEHQLVYSFPERRVSTTLLYDQLPVPRPGEIAKPIVLLAPKTWVSTELSTWVVFATASADDVVGYQERPLEISVLDERGTLVATSERLIPSHDVVVFDVRAAVEEHVSLTRSPTFFDVVARGGAGSFAILTVLVNGETGGCAIEHSLSPHYYASRLDRLRSEALRSDVLSKTRVKQ